MANLKLSAKVKGVGGIQLKLRKSLSKVIGDIAYEAAIETKRLMPSRFRLRRQWIVRGIRFLRPRRGELVAKVFSLDQFMEKQEEGASLFDRALVQSRFLQNRGRFLGDRPRELLTRRNYFIDERGLFERLEGHKLRSWYHYAVSRHYTVRLKLRETTEMVARRISSQADRYLVIR